MLTLIVKELDNNQNYEPKENELFFDSFSSALKFSFTSSTITRDNSKVIIYGNIWNCDFKQNRPSVQEITNQLQHIHFFNTSTTTKNKLFAPNSWPLTLTFQNVKFTSLLVTNLEKKNLSSNLNSDNIFNNNNITFVDCQFQRNKKESIVVEHSSSWVFFDHCTITDSEIGITIRDANVSLLNCNISRNWYCGVKMRANANVRMFCCFLTFNSIAIDMSTSCAGDIAYNMVLENDTGFDIEENESCLIYDNDVYPTRFGSMSNDVSQMFDYSLRNFI